MQKNLLTLFAAITVCTSPVLAQDANTDKSIGLSRAPTKKGELLLGSNFVSSNIASNDGLKTASYDVGLTPRVGYFVNDRLVLGVNLYASTAGYQKDRYSSVGLGVFGRYYFGRAHEESGEINRLRFFVEGGAYYGFGFVSQKQMDDTRIKRTERDLGVYVMPGVNYFLSKNVALEAGLSFSRSRDNVHPVYYGSIDKMSLNVGLQFFIGKR